MKVTTLVAAFSAVLLAAPAFADDGAAVLDEKNAPAAQEKVDDPLPIHAYVNTGVYSGYQLYGSLVNSEPTIQSYGEINFDLPKAGDFDLGFIGFGFWMNNDLTDKRHNSYGKWANEQDYNIHYEKFFSFNGAASKYDPAAVGLLYRASVVWYYYPHHRGHGYSESTSTTMDFDHSLALINPYVTPYVDIVHEYHENNADLLQFGLRKPMMVGNVLLTPSVNFVYRDHRYNWCFPTAGFTEFHNGGLATVRVQLDADYWFNENWGLFAKVAYCSVIDKDLRDAADNGSGADYGQYKDFAWGGVGVQFKF